MACLACPEPTATVEFELTTGDPALSVLCFEHYRDLVRKRAAAAEQAAEAAVWNARRTEIMARPKPTCYGEHGLCPRAGALYPSGTWCPEHAPNATGPRHPVDAAPIEPARSPLPVTETEQSVDAAPILMAEDCPPELMPRMLRSACQTAENHGWVYRVTRAIGPDGLHSICLLAQRLDRTLTSCHEGADGKPLHFKAAWHRVGNGLPIKLGWRELVAALAGSDPLEVERATIREAVLAVMDAGGTVIAIEETG